MRDMASVAENVAGPTEYSPLPSGYSEPRWYAT
jgi:hypothetical protein